MSKRPRSSIHMVYKRYSNYQQFLFEALSTFADAIEARKREKSSHLGYRTAIMIDRSMTDDVLNTGCINCLRVIRPINIETIGPRRVPSFSPQSANDYVIVWFRLRLKQRAKEI